MTRYAYFTVGENKMLLKLFLQLCLLHTNYAIYKMDGITFYWPHT